ncbi:hypothetical protein SAMN05660860_02858 [Geoalkalibacter ferrihydriticus]|uniref:Lipoprotein SmpA/OmlA domain-containing protein n=2 Tax=Geoalkalibacter ferrihydriticus TaxID=392333 RepID=A0A0C2DQN8_9BACT|nr:hypothetical protein [Geoalkalibacter ferrihydriticus]KIH75739.1 hypothetical protein GFER_14105 [Geoalkalibacter ferrihydriticus DSM 17813]SDM62840.1 hypothetical protein SAMN05660860_02858 [Geoalkalibacter ferrihydriticus]
MFLRRWLFFCALLALLPACSPSLESGARQLNAANLGNSLVHGQTSRQDVYNHLGPPQSIIHPGDSSRPFLRPDAGRHPLFPDAEVWTYSGRSIAHAKALDPRPIVHRHTTLRIFFDQNGILQDYSLRETQN